MYECNWLETFFLNFGETVFNNDLNSSYYMRIAHTDGNPNNM